MKLLLKDIKTRKTEKNDFLFTSLGFFLEQDFCFGCPRTQSSTCLWLPSTGIKGVRHFHSGSKEASRGRQTSWNWSYRTGSYEPPWRGWEMNSGLLQKEQALLTAEPSWQPPNQGKIFSDFTPPKKKRKIKRFLSPQSKEYCLASFK